MATAPGPPPLPSIDDVLYDRPLLWLPIIEFDLCSKNDQNFLPIICHLKFLNIRFHFFEHLFSREITKVYKVWGKNRRFQGFFVQEIIRQNACFYSWKYCHLDFLFIKHDFFISLSYIKAYYYKKVGLVDLSTFGGKIKFEFGLSRQRWDGRIQILFSRHEYSSPQLSYNNNKPLVICVYFNIEWIWSLWPLWPLESSSRKFSLYRIN